MNKQIELVRQALTASESSIRLAKQLLTELEQGSPSKGVATALPGIIGTFDGESMVTESGDKYPVPANYASKSMLIVGDTMKLVDEKGSKRFKQIEHVKRYKTKGTLTKKEGKFHVVSQEGSYKVLPASVDHAGIAVGEELQIVIPAKNQSASWAAIESPSDKSEKSADKTQELKEDKAKEVEVKPPEKKKETELVVESKPEKSADKTQEIGEEKVQKVEKKLPENKKETELVVESKPEKAEPKKVKTVKVVKKETPKETRVETEKTTEKSTPVSKVEATKTATQKPPVTSPTQVDEELA